MLLKSRNLLEIYLLPVIILMLFFIFASGCSDGDEVNKCKDECIGGSGQCLDDSTRIICEDSNGDGCKEYTTREPCPDGFKCTAGMCKMTCVDNCDRAGDTVCVGEYISTCRRKDGALCLTMSEPESCPTGEICDDGQCIDRCKQLSGLCDPSISLTKCDPENTNSVMICADHFDQGCYQWGEGDSCPEGQGCKNGRCELVCEDECVTPSAHSCDGDAIVTCGDYNHDGCLELGARNECLAGQTCSEGKCSIDCQFECYTFGDKQCVQDTVFQCINNDSDDCYELVELEKCINGFTCSNGECTSNSTCEDECPSIDAVKCQGNAFQKCGAYGGNGDDTCLKWGGLTYCSIGEVCSEGICICNNECTPNTKVCSADYKGYKSCVSDPTCAYWGDEVLCPQGQICKINGQCENSDTEIYENETEVLSENIPDNPGNNTGVTKTINLPSMMIKKLLKVCALIDHEQSNDLKIELIPPDGNTIILQNRNTGSRLIANKCFVTSNDADVNSVYISELNRFENMNIAGLWQMKVSDLSYSDTGSFISWKIMFEKQAQTQVDNIESISSDTPLLVPDCDGTYASCIPGVVTSSMSITANLTITNLRITIDIDHGDEGDLKITLISPSNEEVILKQGDNSLDSYSATTYISSGNLSENTLIIPELSAFIGDSSLLLQ